MKKINDLIIWKDGKNVIANVLNLLVTTDNLSNSATFYFCLLYIDEQNNYTNIVDGNIVMDGSVYDKYTNNEYAYKWAAKNLGLTIIGNYVPKETAEIV